MSDKNRKDLETPWLQKADQQTVLLLHFQSHVNKRYKTGLFKTMLHRAYALSSTTEAFSQECAKVRSIFCRLDIQSKTLYWRRRTSKRHIILTVLKIS